MPQTTLAAHDWINEVCRRFSAVAGWPLRFELLRSEADCAAAPDELEPVWFVEIHDSEKPIGRLVLDLPASAVSDRSFLGVQEFAELVGDLVQRLAASRRQLWDRTAQFSTLVDVSRSLPRKQNPLSALGQLLQAATELTGFRSAAFFLLDPTTSRLKLRAQAQIEGREIPLPERELQQCPPDLEAFNCGRLLWRPKADARDSRWLPEGSAMGLCLPVESEAGPFGTLWVFDRRDRAPGQHEYHVLESIAAQIASVLERVVLKHESELQHRMSRDLAVASESQSTHIASSPAHDPRLDVAAACTSRYELGGDLCEVLPLQQGRTTVAVGDASGDSVPAAMIMSAVRGALRSIVWGPGHDASHPDQVIYEVNRVLYGLTPAHQFMSLLYGVLDTGAMRFTYTNAGHPPPLVGRNGCTQPLTSHGMLLGVVEKFDYTRSVVELRGGDVLVLYSDGISEAMSKGREMFRCDGIAEAVERHMSGTARDVLQAIWSKLETHTRGGEADDRTLLVIKLRD